MHYEEIYVNLALSHIGFLMLGGVLFSFVNYITLKMFRAASASAIVILSLLNTVSVVIISILFANESLTPIQLLGALLLVSSALFSKWITSKKNSNIVTIRVIFAAIIASVLYGFAIINEKYLIEQLSIPTYLLFGWGFQAVIATLIALKLGLRKQMKTTRKNHIDIWLLGGLLPLYGVFFVLSIDVSKSASLTIVGSTLRVIVTLVLAYIFLKEKDRLALKAICVIVAMTGFFLLT